MSLCPKCQGHTRVVDSRFMADGLKRRRHRCAKCEHKFSTVEVLVGEEPASIKMNVLRHALTPLMRLAGITATADERAVAASTTAGIIEWLNRVGKPRLAQALRKATLEKLT